MEVVTLLTIMEPDLQDSALLMKHLEKHSSTHKCLRRGSVSAYLSHFNSVFLMDF